MRLENDVPVTEAHGLASEKDREYWSNFGTILENSPHSEEHLLALWPVYVRRISMVRFLSHYELFKKIQNLPGDILDLGVSRGVSFFTFHKMLELFNPTDTSRKVIGVDSFEGLQDFSSSDGIQQSVVGKSQGGWSAKGVESEIMQMLDLHNSDGVLTKTRGMIYKTRIQDLGTRLAQDRPGMRIALLHLDMDLYEPTLEALRMFWDLVLPGGLVVFDEFALPPWEGETKAWEDFAAERQLSYVIEKFPGTLNPNGFLIKR
jgi:hypothetical protein